MSLEAVNKELVHANFNQNSLLLFSLSARGSAGEAELSQGSVKRGKSQIETSLVIFEPRGLSCCLLPLTSRRIRRGTARFEPCISLGMRPAMLPVCCFAEAPRK